MFDAGMTREGKKKKRQMDVNALTSTDQNLLFPSPSSVWSIIMQKDRRAGAELRLARSSRPWANRIRY